MEGISARPEGLVGTQSETPVTCSQMTPTDEAAAQAVADSISGAVTLAYGPTTNGADVTVTTAANFSIDSPTPPGTPFDIGAGRLLASYLDLNQPPIGRCLQCADFRRRASVAVGPSILHCVRKGRAMTASGGCPNVRISATVLKPSIQPIGL
jgi:hypothetical protein